MRRRSNCAVAAELLFQFRSARERFRTAALPAFTTLAAASSLTLQRALDAAGTRFTADDLESVLPAMARYLLAGALRGWLFNVNVEGKPLPYVVARLDFTPSSNDDTGKVYLELRANAKASLANVSVRISAADW